ncbi:MAG TPA: tetratricopeptide repeat protein [Pyrinomonadaceae bacterium]|nr:tetratricopeptide repeat protein [Pyrinomonadaceae bacterium]
MRKNSSNSHKKAHKAQALLLLCLLCLFAAAARAQSTDVLQAFEQVAALIRDDRLAEADKELTRVLKLQPDLPVALNLMGSLRAKQGRLAEAESLFLRAVQNDKNFTGARMNLVYLYLLKRAPDKAIPQLNEVLALEPENLEAKVLLGDAYLAKNDLPKAEENYLAALDNKLNNAGALFGLAQISRIKGEQREVAIYLNRVGTLITDSTSTDFLYKFALEAMQVGLFDEAKSALERAVTLKPKDPSYLLALGIAWLRKTDLFEAEKIFRRVLVLEPNNAQAQLHLGYVLLNQKKYAEARTWLEKSARTSAAIPEVFYYLGLVAQEQNNDAGAIVLFEKAVRQLPSYAHARIALGSSYMKLKNYVRARQELETAVKLDPNEPTAHYNLALLYARIKEPDRAKEELRIIDQLKAKGASNNGVVVLPPKSNP